MWKVRLKVSTRMLRPGMFFALSTAELPLGVNGADRCLSLQQTEKAVASARKARRKKWICFWICGTWTSTRLGHKECQADMSCSCHHCHLGASRITDTTLRLCSGLDADHVLQALVLGLYFGLRGNNNR